MQLSQDHVSNCSMATIPLQKTHRPFFKAFSRAARESLAFRDHLAGGSETEESYDSLYSCTPGMTSRKPSTVDGHPSCAQSNSERLRKRATGVVAGRRRGRNHQNERRSASIMGPVWALPGTRHMGKATVEQVGPFAAIIMAFSIPH